ncbi:protein AAR2 homolog isoform X2 [Scylla paramamosain]|uniref:protein AAR2 homolog isoform X2 n=1 Tax=Scylla paramamosain TaxID=85552 RepID=UPI003083B15C
MVVWCASAGISQCCASLPAIGLLPPGFLCTEHRQAAPERYEYIRSLVTELQVAFVSFLVAQVWDGWEQWRCLVRQLFRTEEVLLEEPQLYAKLLSVLHYQLMSKS